MGLSCLKTLRSRRFLARSRAVTVVASLKLKLRGWELSTAASDAERQRVFEQDSPTFPDSTTYRGVSPNSKEEEKSMPSYSTTTRKKIHDYLEQNSDRTVTVADIDTYLKELNSEVNLTTIYRYLDKLAKEGIVIKYVAEKGSQATYQYVEKGHHCEEHLHLKCVSCGCIIHLECGFMDEIAEHILKDHGFELQCKNSMIYGLCRECRENKKK